MPRDEIDAGEVLKKLAELKRTLPEDQYQSIERQVRSHFAEHFGGSEPAQKKSWIRGALGCIGALLLLVLFGILAERFEWVGYIFKWVGYILGAAFALSGVLRGLLGFFAWLSNAMKPPRMY